MLHLAGSTLLMHGHALLWRALPSPSLAASCFLDSPTAPTAATYAALHSVLIFFQLFVLTYITLALCAQEEEPCELLPGPARLCSRRVCGKAQLPYRRFWASKIAM